MPFALAPDALRSMLEGISIPKDFEVVLSTARALDPISDPDGARGALDELRDAGATSVTCTVAARSAVVITGTACPAAGSGVVTTTTS